MRLILYLANSLPCQRQSLMTGIISVSSPSCFRDKALFFKAQSVLDWLRSFRLDIGHLCETHGLRYIRCNKWSDTAFWIYILWQSQNVLKSECTSWIWSLSIYEKLFSSKFYGYITKTYCWTTVLNPVTLDSKWLTVRIGLLVTKLWNVCVYHLTAGTHRSELLLTWPELCAWATWRPITAQRLTSLQAS